MKERATDVTLKGCKWNLCRFLQQGELEDFYRQVAAVCFIRSETCGKITMVCCSAFCDLTNLGCDMSSSDGKYGSF